MDAAQREILAGNLERIRERIAAACARVKRDPKDVTLIAVTKTVGPDVMQALIELGVTDIGENKLQSAQEKFPKVPGLRDRAKVKRHFIGHLQTNKVKGVLELFDVIHSLDSLKLATEIARRASAAGKSPFPCFVEVNVSGELTKSGFQFNEMDDVFLRDFGWERDIQILGFMTMAPHLSNAELARPVFRDLCSELISWSHYLQSGDDYRGNLSALSMGMSNDFEIAIEEGATHVRIGTALFEGISPA